MFVDWIFIYQHVILNIVLAYKLSPVRNRVGGSKQKKRLVNIPLDTIHMKQFIIYKISKSFIKEVKKAF